MRWLLCLLCGWFGELVWWLGFCSLVGSGWFGGVAVSFWFGGLVISVGWVCLTQALVFLAWVALFRVCGWFDVGLISFKWFGFIIELRLLVSLWYRWDLLLDCEFAGGWYFGWCCDVCFILFRLPWMGLDLLGSVALGIVVACCGCCIRLVFLWWLYWCGVYLCCLVIVVLLVLVAWMLWFLVLWWFVLYWFAWLICFLWVVWLFACFVWFG